MLTTILLTRVLFWLWNNSFSLQGLVGGWFGFVLETLLVTVEILFLLLLLSSAYTSQGLFCFSHHPTREGAGGARVVRREGTFGTADPNWPKGYPTSHDIILSILRGGEKGGEQFEWRCLSSQVTITQDEAQRPWGWLNTCLSLANGEVIPWFALLACAASALPIELSLSQPMSFLTFTLLIPPVVLQKGTERAAVWCLVTRWG